MRNRLLHAGWCLAVSAGLFSVGHAETAPSPPSARRLTPLVQMIERVRESTVNINTEKRQKSQLDVMFSANKGGNKINGMGTGIVVDERGFILTNNHVIQDVESIRVTLANGETFVASVFQTDPKNDLALIQITPRTPLKVIPMGTSSDLMLAEDVIAIGNAYGYTDSITRGIVSALHRDVEAGDDQAYFDLIQTDAAINPGNSGGPLINADGEVIGINVAIRAGATKIGFAIPIDAARAATAKMFNVERTAKLYHGAVMKDHKFGSIRELLVQAVKPNSPAASAGLQAGDVVLKVGNTTVADAADFERALIDRKATESLPILVNRAGKEEALGLQLVAIAGEPARQTVVANMAPATTASAKSERIWDALGVRLQPLPEKDNRLTGLPYKGGMVVTDVRRDSVAMQNGVKRGDILVGLHSYETVKENDVLYVLNHSDLKSISPLKFYIVRDRETLYGHFATTAK